MATARLPPVRSVSVGMDRHVLENLLPVLRQVVVHDGRGNEARVHHFHQVVVLEALGRLLDCDGGFAFRLQRPVQRLQARMVAGRLADEDFLPGQVIQRGDGRRARGCDKDLVHVLPRRIGEVHDFLPLGRDCQLGDDHVDLTRLERRNQHVPRHRDGDDVDLQIAGLQFLVQLLFEEGQVFVGESPLDTFVDEVERAVERYRGPDQPALDHLVEVSGEGRAHHGAHVFGERLLVRRRRQLFFARRRARRARRARPFRRCLLRPPAAHRNSRHKNGKQPSRVRVHPVNPLNPFETEKGAAILPGKPRRFGVPRHFGGA